MDHQSPVRKHYCQFGLIEVCLFLNLRIERVGGGNFVCANTDMFLHCARGESC